ncbi:MAG: hypothetical protein CMN58_05085 [Solibacterales bacterium]|nr:hypothetical protein [Bryobacterales bacterium]|tara:strand:- start:7810 stop:8610 length:801 start_codon:yes stop_codon:yes gene_type:complete
MVAKLLFGLYLITVALHADSSLAKTDHAIWNALLAEYVDDKSRVDYARLKKQASDHLETYVRELSLAGQPDPKTPQGKAFLINAYNALVIEWIVKNYPVKSIMATPNPFRKARHKVAGEKMSLDEIESRLRATGDPRIHAALVCAARSCPPLRTEAYTPDHIDQQLEDNTRRWLANSDLNKIDAAHRHAEVSAIFEWYKDDFISYPGGLSGFLRHYSPPKTITATVDDELRIIVKDYDWGLNDQSNIGAGYSSLQLALDWLISWFR